jgi:hypothetical protein
MIRNRIDRAYPAGGDSRYPGHILLQAGRRGFASFIGMQMTFFIFFAAVAPAGIISLG